MDKVSQTNNTIVSNSSVTSEQHLHALKQTLSELREAAEAQGTIQEFRSRIDETERRLQTVQKEILDLLRRIPTSEQSDINEETPTSPAILRIKNWEDYKDQCSYAQIVSFLCNGPEGTFKVDCLKNGRLYTFDGVLPKETHLVAAWLSRELKVEEKRVLEGILELVK